MIMVQKPVHLLSSPSTYHRRHPSAPPAVLVQPTRIPGLLSLSKPHPVTPPRSQQQQQIHNNHHNRQPRSTHSKSKPTGTARQSPPSPAAAQPQSSEDLNKLSSSTRPVTKSHILPTTLSPTPEKPPRGRQSSKQGKDKSKPRNNNRRHQSQLHQGSPPNPSNLPSQAEIPDKATSPRHARHHNSFDPFLASSESESDNPPSNPARAKPPVHPTPKLAPRPSGKLARRRQNVTDVLSTPTPSKAMSVPRPHGQLPTWQSRPLPVSRSVPTLSAMDVFPICDDLTDAEDDDVFAPSTPVRVGGGHVTWQPSLVYDDGPRTAPLTNPRSSFPFNPKPPTFTPTPERKRQHARSPSEGVFNLSMDEDSSSSSLSDPSGERKAKDDIPPRRRIASAASTPMGSKRDFWASSKFQNSPSPDVLPAPAFKAQATL
ncbi:hypothetical protein BJV78DRAFT_549066 [Lactifluus subvellereus]|nr:hypothetical protein BJV78DRAFT_549066 [Lactifluus subvellereus]